MAKGDRFSEDEFGNLIKEGDDDYGVLGVIVTIIKVPILLIIKYVKFTIEHPKIGLNILSYIVFWIVLPVAFSSSNIVYLLVPIPLVITVLLIIVRVKEKNAIKRERMELARAKEEKMRKHQEYLDSTKEVEIFCDCCGEYGSALKF
jgi:hypothetical protein